MHVDHIDPAFGHWFAGFIDGEGCFFVRRNVTKYNGDAFVCYGCSLSVAMRDDDIAVLETVRDTLDMGNITRYHQAQTAKQKPSACLYIGKKNSVLSLVDFFDRFPLRTKKARDYEVWRRAVIEWHRERGAKTRGRDWSRMAELHEELKAIRKYV